VATLEELVSVWVGLPRTIEGEPPWLTSIYKVAVQGPVWLRREHLEGDRQADPRVHGGVDKAVCVYPIEHFERWRIELGLPELASGAFGENFSVAGQSESTVCIGDTYRVGSAVVQVSQPRGPCWKVARRWSRGDLARRIRESGRTGWYLRVVAPGLVMAGDRFERLERPFAEWTIQRVNDLSYDRDAAVEDLRALAACPLLAPSWRDGLFG
jgi:MOSC domain-containing protein YiiM